MEIIIEPSELHESYLSTSVRGGVVTESGCAPDIDIGCVCDDFDINF